MSKSFPTPSKTFFILFFLHLFLSLVLRLTGQLEQRIFNEILIYGALAYSMIGSQWNYDPSYLKTSSVLFLLYLLSIYTLQDFSNNGLSASEAIEWGCTCQQKLDTKLKKSGIKNESMYKIHQLF